MSTYLVTKGILDLLGPIDAVSFLCATRLMFRIPKADLDKYMPLRKFLNNIAPWMGFKILKGHTIMFMGKDLYKFTHPARIMRVYTDAWWDHDGHKKMFTIWGMAVAANRCTNWLTLSTRQTSRVDSIWVGRYGRYYPDRAEAPISESAT